MLAALALGFVGASFPLVAESGPEALTVFAASSLTEAFREAGAAFERRERGVRVEFSFASSALLRTQIEQGAPADLVASADWEILRPLVQAGRVRGAVEMARNRLVIITPAANPGRVGEARDLARAGLRLVMTSPEVPIGRYSREALEKMSAANALGSDFRAAVMRNVISQEPNVRVLVSRVVLGEADAAIVYATDARAAGAKVRTVPIPARYNVTAAYPAAVVAASPRAAHAERFLAFVRSRDGRAILRRHGFE
jgi:molybdate transport system substrate-binding protein